MLTVWLLHLEACLWLHCLYTSESRSKGMVCYFVAMTEVTFQSSIKNENPVTKPLEELVSLSYSLLQKDDKYCTKEFWGINLTWKRSRFKHSSCLIQMKIWSKILVFISSALTLGPSLCHGPKRFFPHQSSEPDKLGLADAKASSKNGAGWYQQMPSRCLLRCRCGWLRLSGLDLPNTFLPFLQLFPSHKPVCSFHCGEENWTWGNICA